MAQLSEKHQIRPENIVASWLLDRGLSILLPVSTSRDEMAANFRDSLRVQMTRDEYMQLGRIEHQQRFIDPRNWGVQLFED